MEKHNISEGHYRTENSLRAKIVAEDKHLVTKAKPEDHGGQIKTNMDEFFGKGEPEKWILYISACGGFGFILKEEAKNFNIEPLGETRTIHNVPDAEGKVTDAMEAHTYEVYG